MADNPYTNKVEYNGDTLMDITDTTATPSDVLEGKDFYLASGQKASGTISVPAPATANPLMDGTVAVGTSTKYAREDHRHPKDTSIPAAATATPLMDGTAAVGSSAKYAKEDHRHPTDTSRYAQPSYQNGTGDIGVRPLVRYARANRLAFLPADQIIIEWSTDGGTTWVDAGATEAQKKALFATTKAGNISLPRLNGQKDLNCGVRITFTAMKYNVPEGTTEVNKYNYWNSNYVKSCERYTTLNEIWFWMNAGPDAVSLQVQAAKGGTPDTWSNIFVSANDTFRMTGWTGSNWVKVGGNLFGGSTGQTTNFWNWRITCFSRYAYNASAFNQTYITSAQQVLGICGYGVNCYTYANAMMNYDSLYSYDVDKNATFPAKVTANGGFTGDLTGNATTATNAPTSASINNSGLITYANSAGTTLFTLQLPLYNGGVT